LHKEVEDAGDETTSSVFCMSDNTSSLPQYAEFSGWHNTHTGSGDGEWRSTAQGSHSALRCSVFERDCDDFGFTEISFLSHLHVTRRCYPTLSSKALS
jgi:hypothetical protein